MSGFTIPKNSPTPPGVMPRNLHRWLLGGIAGAIILATVFSGKKAEQATSGSSVPAPSAEQLTAMRKALAQQQELARQARLEAERSARTGKELTSAPPSVPPPVPHGAMRPGVVNGSERHRVPIIALSVEPTATGDSEAAKKPQVALDFEHEKPTPAQEPVPETPLKGSGELLPARVGDLFRLYQGTMIKTRLVNRLDGAFPGPVSCLVVESVMSGKAKVLLIPTGSRFLGRASRVEAQNQTRLAVVFDRLIMPNGYSLQLQAAPGLDKAGATGLKDRVDTHRRRAFSVSGAIGLLSGLALSPIRGGGFAAGVATSMGNTATATLNRYLNVLPTITIREGYEVTVYLPNDILLPAYNQ